uniref:ADF-H domain-containing protein n=1 Tax=Attheya septentrionalis TaxID=420275 RepID=A0A7S2XQT8_9STRA|mmetsp:Transcript_3375/g.6142  ORF Transcript_3375/g.6142 Transcript_3375/m.6142 type:complete len:144 (+) Transcript_3375:100-531(+)|eukprot:CAMPEP_0198280620 /NCGR_PEP_ID=MMETSP1449-20131203/679_1 /TAXON_ID=420275 /ORGANISM="Attheya septentrionalis, Strain CCMP2084" /LENGTH=143 /DNA_ID=CAMNT_0043976037 /DNA_START=63 /DNA_END=494 /DNA_ORIENTATION=+
MATGVVCKDEILESYNAFRLKQAPYDCTFIIYKISDDKATIEIDTCGDREKTYEDFCEALPENDCRYGLLDLDFETADGRPTSKLVLLQWNPDNAKIKSKILYAGSKEALKASMPGIGIQVQANDHSELSMEDSILPVVRKFA